ncbi:MAG: peptidoglycan-associated lipoprotein Pal [Endomicrobiales bacterium]
MVNKLLIVIGGVLLMWGCAKKQVVKPTPEGVPTPPVAEESKDEPSVRFADWQGVPELRAVYFDYDQSELAAKDREVLKQNAEYLKNNQGLSVLVEGYCDERGTIEYNLALGQRRATAVRDYYGQLGVPLGRVGTISYGEEKPFDPGHTEAAWAKNRRAETKVRSGK